MIWRHESRGPLPLPKFTNPPRNYFWSVKPSLSVIFSSATLDRSSELFESSCDNCLVVTHEHRSIMSLCAHFAVLPPTRFSVSAKRGRQSFPMRSYRSCTIRGTTAQYRLRHLVTSRHRDTQQISSFSPGHPNF